MTNILIIGAGRSATALINYVLKESEKYGWFVTVADANLELAQSKVAGHPQGRGVWLDALKVNDRRDLIGRANVVVSMLPAYLHLEVAYDCVRLKKHLVTASYLTKELYLLSDQVLNEGLIFMGELGLDPGIDHMSAMKKINEIKAKGGELTGFRSYTGGLIAPESDDNPWHYKFTWNPRNVVVAGQGTAQYLESGKNVFVPYHQLFGQSEVVEILNQGPYEVYANRNSLLYRELYNLEDIPNIWRGTIRHVGYCKAWNALIKLGLTEAAYPITDSDKLTYHDLLEGLLYHEKNGSTLKEKAANYLQLSPNDEVMQKLEWLGLFEHKKIGLEKASPAFILENLLFEKWKLRAEDKDMIIMQHEFHYRLREEKRKLTSTMVLKGENAQETAMSKLVGLPLGIFVKNVMLGNIKSTGVNIPVKQEVYEPVLEELEEYGVFFEEKEEVVES